jgi:PAB-dependent poly(A)-specific ribonuclease subunit 3
MPCSTTANGLTNMSHGGQEPSFRFDFSYMATSLSNINAPRLPLPTIQRATPNKGAPSQTPTPNRAAFFPLSTSLPHANATASSGSSSTTDSLSELTSHSSRDSLPAALVRRGDSTPQKQARSYRRNKPSRSNARWSRGGAGSSDDTGSDRKPPTSPLNSNAPSFQPAYTQRQPHLASNNPAVIHGHLMATTFGSPSGDSRRGVTSPRPKGRGMHPVMRSHVTFLIRLCRS